MDAPSSKPLFVLATRTRHTLAMLGEPIEHPADPALSRGIQIERTCPRCGTVRVIALWSGTDAGGGAGGILLWRAKGRDEQVVHDPGCVGDEVVMARSAAAS